MNCRRSILLSAVAALAWSGSIGAQAPPYRAVGPLPVTAHSYPFGAADRTRTPTDLRVDGYVEEEFLFSGVANVYDWPQAGPAVVRTSGVPYTTRVLVRRPAARSRFSGTIVVEMLNPSNLFDLNIGWAISGRQLVRNGDAWVGITAKPVAVASLQAFNPTRYAALSWPNPLPLTDERNCTAIGADSQRSTENGLIWDMHRQIALWLRARGDNNPFTYGTTTGVHPVARLYAWGYSQTGGFLYTYVNAIHPIDVKELGKPLFDAYLIAVASGPSPIHQCFPALPVGDPRRRVSGVGVPVVRVMSQSDYLPTIASRLPDSDTPPDLLRNYEIAGSGHATPDELAFAAAPDDIIKAGRAVPPMACTEGPRSRFPSRIAFNAILQNVDRWVRTGVPAPRAEQIRVVDGTPEFDQYGNVVGGVRSPFLDVPTSTWSGNSTGASFCRIAGHEMPFDRARLDALYPKTGDYAGAVAANVKSLVAGRFITEADGQELIAEARMMKTR